MHRVGGIKALSQASVTVRREIVGATAGRVLTHSYYMYLPLRTLMDAAEESHVSLRLAAHLQGNSVSESKSMIVIDRTPHPLGQRSSDLSKDPARKKYCQRSLPVELDRMTVCLLTRAMSTQQSSACIGALLTRRAINLRTTAM